VASNIEIIGLDKVLKRNREILDRFAVEVERALEQTAQETANIAKEKVPVDTGNLRQNIQVERPNRFLRIVHTGAAQYAPYVEFGTSPHFPPLQPIKRWALRKLGDERAGYPVAKKIAQAGTEEKPYMRPAFEEMKPKYIQRLRQIARQVSGR
jgi:phage protein, HK97 gp10 family